MCSSDLLETVSLARWDDWLTRQLLYLKFCIPPGWIASIAAVLLLAAPPAAAAAMLAAWTFGAGDGADAAFSAAYLAVFAGLGLCFRSLSPRPVAVLAWLRGYAATFLMLGWCFGRTFTTNTMSWRGIRYKVGWGGVVLRVIRD